MIEVLDNVLTESEINQIEEYIDGDRGFPWFTGGTSTVSCSNISPKWLNHPNIVESYQFFHFLYTWEAPEKKSVFSEPSDFLCGKLGITSGKLIRSKVNFQTQIKNFPSHCHNTPHIDSSSPHNVYLYYVNESDGDTFFFNDNQEVIKRVSHKRGRIVHFDGSIYHAGSNPSKYDRRITINIDYETNNSSPLLWGISF